MPAIQEHPAMRKKIFEGTEKEFDAYRKNRPVSDTKRFTVYEDDGESDDRPPLTSEQIESIERGLEDIRAGRYVSNEQHSVDFAKWKRDFLAKRNES